MKILVVDDDARIRDALTVGLELQWDDVQVLTADDGEKALDTFFESEPDVVLLDIMLPRANGFEVLKAIRRVSDTPVILLTARGEDVDQVRGLELGADDYVVKPFSHLALLARIKGVLRRAKLPGPVQSAPDFVAGDLTVRFADHMVTVGGKPVTLTPVEFRLLYHLVRNAGRLMPHEALLDRIWGADHDAAPEHLKVFVSRLRSKIEYPGGPRYIETVRGVGYRFVKPQPAVAPPQAVGTT